MCKNLSIKGQYLAKNEPISDDIFTFFGFDVLTKWCFPVKRPQRLIQTWPCGPVSVWICSFYGFFLTAVYLAFILFVYCTINNVSRDVSTTSPPRPGVFSGPGVKSRKYGNTKRYHCADAKYCVLDWVRPHIFLFLFCKTKTASKPFFTFSWSLVSKVSLTFSFAWPLEEIC